LIMRTPLPAPLPLAARASLCAALPAALILAAAHPGRAQESYEAYQVPAVRVEEAPRIDGRLDEPLWEHAAVVDEFTQQEPSEGSPATERTEVRVLYDGGSLFLGVRAYDSSFEPPRATEMRRVSDRILEEDNFQVILDTFMDQRTAYMFAVNPLGAQLDQQIFDEGGRDRRASAQAINKEWDGVWSVATSRASDHWVAEIEIPMVTLRFPNAERQSWGINFMRNIRRKNEQVFWAPIPREFSLTRVSLAGSLRDLRELDRGLDLRVKPYVTSGGRWTHDLDLSNGSDASTQADVGLDLKYGITAGLNLDVTLNTDFAQAEVDNEQVNLTRFALFFPEKREFFLENSGLFTVGTINSQGNIANLFFSRRIGLTETGAPVPVLGGARLTGKVGGSNNIAVMDLQTDEAYGLPGENFLVARYSRDIGRSRIGGAFINKQASEGGHYNRTYAADLNWVVSDALTVDGFIATTETRGISGDELGGHVRAGWLDQSWRVYGEYTDLGDEFNPEVGFVPRVGMRRSKIHIEYNPRPGKWGIRMMDPMWNVTYITDQEGRLESRQFHHMLGTYFSNGASLILWHNRYFERIDEEFRVGGVPIEPGDYRFWDFMINFRSDPSRRIYYGVRWSPQTFYGGDRTDVSGSLGVRVTDQLAASVDFARNDVDLPNGDFTADIASLQIDYAFSPAISLRSLTQYNSLTDQVSTSARLRYQFRPGSDLYLVYDEVRRDIPLTVDPFVNEYRDRQLLLKMTYLFSF
ncbi:MAG TPA: DUF5916 domain-containing protein, partial [Longimicrobiales bacterium]|nr:DUF5916 domain-containing protein [Longimicrobiales bacterium]